MLDSNSSSPPLRPTPSLATDGQIKQQLKLAHPKLRLLYVTPESLCRKDYQASFQTAYDQRQLARIVVDEAHVLHEWGNGFRPVGIRRVLDSYSTS